MQITDSQLVYSGAIRPPEILAFFDAGNDHYVRETPGDVTVLERYFTDIQNLFLKNLSLFLAGDGDDGFGSVGTILQTESQTFKLRALLEELIKVKALISVNSASSAHPAKPKAVSKQKQSQRPSPNQRRRNK